MSLTACHPRTPVQLAAHLAEHFRRAVFYHRLLRDMAFGGTVRAVPGDGTVLVSVPAAVWRAVQQEADQPSPEPLNP